MPNEREEAIEAIMRSGSGHSREWAESFLAILGSGLRRRGFIEGEPLPQDKIAEHVDRMAKDQVVPDA